jgi:hypothetical protein
MTFERTDNYSIDFQKTKCEIKRRQSISIIQAAQIGVVHVSKQ